MDDFARVGVLLAFIISALIFILKLFGSGLIYAVGSLIGFGDNIKINKLVHNAEDFISKDNIEPLNNTLNEIRSIGIGLLTRKNKDAIVDILNTYSSNNYFSPSSPLLNNDWLSFAIENNQLEVIKKILHFDIDIDNKNDFGNTPLMIAVENNNQDIVKLLLEAKAKINIENNDRYNALFFAIQNNDQSMADLLINAGADIESKGPNNMTPLHYATEYKCWNVAELLINKGANINAKDGSNVTPLHYAVEGGNKDIVTLLINNGADVNALFTASTEEKVTPLYIAKTKGYMEIADLLRQKGGYVPGSKLKSVFDKDTQFVE